MGFEAKYVKYVTYPLWLLRDKRLSELRFRREFLELTNAPREVLRARQLDRLRSMLQHAETNCAFYRESIQRSRIDTANMTVDDLRKMPVLDKSTIRKNEKQMIASNFSIEELMPASTGGSTGVSLNFYRDRDCMALRRAQEGVFDNMIGYGVGDRAALFVSASHSQSRFDHWKKRLRNMTSTLLLQFDPIKTTDPEMFEFYEELINFRPKFIKCFPNSLMIFSDYVTRKNLAVPRVHGVICTGENLYESQRAFFEAVWGGPVYERYATKECGIIAGEGHLRNGLNVFTEGCVVEIVDDDGNPVSAGEIGHVVVTDLFNYGMPLIRYGIGDMAEMGQKVDDENAVGFPRLSKIIGRDRDIVVTMDGVKRPGYLFVEEISKSGIDAKFQIVQTEVGKIEVRVASEAIDLNSLSYLTKKFETLLGPGSNVTLKRVTDIPRDPSGKYRYVKSELTANP